MIVKQAGSTEQNSSSNEGPAWTLFNEWASLEFLNAIATDNPFGPRFYGGDRTSRLVVMEDLGTGQRLDHLLLGNDPVAAEATLIEHAAIHGRLHALTIGKHDEFNAIREGLEPRTTNSYYSYKWLASNLRAVVEAVNIPFIRGVYDELTDLITAFQNPGPFLAFTQADSCPDNCMLVNSRLRLLDFEGGQFSHALLEGVYGRIHFPTCWCVYRFPEHIPLRMEAAYRAELIKGCPHAADDTLFYRAVVQACIFWLLNYAPLATLLKEDRITTTTTPRQRFIVRAEIVSRVTEQFSHMEAIGATIKAVATKLRAIWPTESVTMPYYPAFR